MQNRIEMLLEHLSCPEMAKRLVELTKKIEQMQTIQKDPVRLVRTLELASLETKVNSSVTYIFNVSKKLAEKFVIQPQIMSGGPHSFSVMRNEHYWRHCYSSDKCGCGGFSSITIESFLESINVPYTLYVHEDGDICDYLSQFDY